MDNLKIRKSKAATLAALYNNARPQGMGYLQFTPDVMTEAQAEEILATQKRFDYLKGRVMKVDLSGDDFNPSLYDRDNGQNAALYALESIQS